MWMSSDLVSKRKFDTLWIRLVVVCSLRQGGAVIVNYRAIQSGENVPMCTTDTEHDKAEPSERVDGKILNIIVGNREEVDAGSIDHKIDVDHIDHEMMMLAELTPEIIL